MGSSTSVVLIVPYAGYNYVDGPLDSYLKGPINNDYLGQHLAVVSGEAISSDLSGSG